MNFLIQTIDGHVEYDFAFHLIHAIKRHNLFAGKEVYTYQLDENVTNHPNCIPIGSLEFVFNYLHHHYQIDKKVIAPLNIPPSLRTDEFLGRIVYIAKKEDILSHNGDGIFVKSNTQYKQVTDVVNDTASLPEDIYLVSEYMDIESEYRAFVQQDMLLDVRHYAGDFTIFPDISVIKKMINAFKNPPLSYTLDIGMVNGTCRIIEVHPFVSCGLYGFQDYNRLPSMCIQGFLYMKREAEKSMQERLLNK